MISDEAIDYFRRERDRHYENARRAIAQVREELDSVQRGLDHDPPQVRTMPGGGQALNPQNWLKAEEALVRYWDAAGVLANLERENEDEQAHGQPRGEGVHEALRRQVEESEADPTEADYGPCIERKALGVTELVAFEEFACEVIQDEAEAVRIGRELLDSERGFYPLNGPETGAEPEFYEEYRVVDREALRRQVEGFDEAHQEDLDADAALDPLLDSEGRAAVRAEESAAPTPIERMADAYFFDREPGTVSEVEYQEKVRELNELVDGLAEWWFDSNDYPEVEVGEDEDPYTVLRGTEAWREKRGEILADLENALGYLRNEEVWRVEYNVAWHQNPVVSWVEAKDEADAVPDELPRVRGPYRGPYGGSEVQVRAVSVRRATPDDLEEFVGEDYDAPWKAAPPRSQR